MEDVSPVVTEHAFKHEIAGADIFHAFRFAMRRFGPDDRGFVMAIGAARDGRTLLEVGFYPSLDGPDVIVHAMPARPKYLRDW